MILHSYSGGGFYLKGIAKAAAQAVMNHGSVPNAVAGVSAGAYTAAVMAMRGAAVLEFEAGNVKMSDAFDSIPLTKKGNLSWRAWLNVLCGKNYLSDQDGRPFLASIISPEHFYNYQQLGTIDCWVMAVKVETGERTFWNLRTDPRSYQEMLDMVEASSRIPVMTQAVKVRGSYYWDGGNRDHNPSELLIRQYGDKATELFSIYARPEDFQVVNPEWAKGFVSTIMRSIEIFSVEVSKSDEEIEKLLCKELNIKRQAVYLPRILKHYYDATPEKLKELEAHAVALTEQAFNQ